MAIDSTPSIVIALCRFSPRFWRTTKLGFCARHPPGGEREATINDLLEKMLAIGVDIATLAIFCASLFSGKPALKTSATAEACCGAWLNLKSGLCACGAELGARSQLHIANSRVACATPQQPLTSAAASRVFRNRNRAPSRKLGFRAARQGQFARVPSLCPCQP